MQKILLTLGVAVILVNTSKAQSERLTDLRDGRTYKTVVIGSQTWMAQNLSTRTVEFSCYGMYKADTTSCKKLGTVYTWKVAQVACPNGWHLPSKEEYQQLLLSLGEDRKHQYDVLVNGEFNALSNGMVPGEVFWTSSETKYQAIGAAFPVHTHKIFINKMSKDRLASVRCLRNMR